METTVEGRGRMGSTVGLSKDLKGTDDGTILDICVCQPFLNLANDRLQ
jgi:cytokinesis protein